MLESLINYLTSNHLYRNHLCRFFRVFRYPICSLRSLTISKKMGASNRRHLFIVGIPRSGTSLLSAVLKQHPAFASAGAESHFMGIRNFCYINLPGMDNATRRNLIASAHSRAELFDRIADFYLRGKPGSYCFFDKTPEHALRADDLLRIFPKSQFCFMVRNPLDAYSSLKTSKVRSYTLEEFGLYWIKACKLIDTIRPEKRIVIKYEELCGEFEVTLMKLANFLSVNPTELIEASSCRRMEPGNFDELTGHSRITKTIDNSTVGQWKTALSLDEQERLVRIVREVAEKFGYREVSMPS